MHRFDVITIKTTLNYKRDQITMNLHQFDVKTIKNVEVRRKTTKLIKLQWTASIWRQNDQNFWVRSQNYKSDLISMNLHRFEVKTIKNVEVLAKHSKQRKTTKLIKLQWIASIWRQNDQNFWVMSLNYKSNQITINCIDLMSKRSRTMSYVAKHSKQRKTTKVFKL